MPVNKFPLNRLPLCLAAAFSLLATTSPAASSVLAADPATTSPRTTPPGASSLPGAEGATDTTTSPSSLQEITTLTLPQRPARITTVPVHLSQLRAPYATAEFRAQNREDQQQILTEAFTTVPQALDEDLWTDALYTATVTPPTDLSREGVRKALQVYQSMSEEFGRTALEAAYGVDPQAFLAEMATIAEVTSSSKHFAMASLYLVRALPDGAGARRDALSRMQRRFPAWPADPILTMLHFDLCRNTAAQPAPSADALTTTCSAAEEAARSRPPLSVLFSDRFAPGWPVVYSVQRPNRSLPGLAVVRKADGRFHRNPDSTIFHITHLARSRTNLPGYITNGNTPQGIFSVLGLGRSRVRAIGETPYLHIFLPNETSPARWFHAPAMTGTSWSLQMYRDLLPEAPPAGEGGAGEETTTSAPAWHDYFPIYTAWYAGAAGRYDILAHGTTVDPSRYQGQPWFPNTPTSGCICAKELWDESTGQALVSEQLALVHAWLEASGISIPRDQPDGAVTLEGKGPEGYLVVVETEDKPFPVTFDEILTEVLRAEKLSAQP